MNIEQHLLVCLIEQNTKIQKASVNALNFGANADEPGGSGVTNRQAISRAILEQMAVIDLLQENGMTIESYDSQEIYEEKQRQVNHYMEHAKEASATA